MSELFDILISASFWAAVIRIASPLIFATMGELICERAGVLNLGIEGIMVIGAFMAGLALGNHLPRDRLADQEMAFQVDVDDGVPVGFADV